MSDEVYDAVCRAQELLHALGSHVLSAREVVDQLDEVRRLLSARVNTVDDAMWVENELLREAFTETTVTENKPQGFFLLRVPRQHWLRLRAWRATDSAHGRAGSRLWRFSYEELRTLDELLDDWTAGRPGENKTQLALRVELQRELDARAYEAMKP